MRLVSKNKEVFSTQIKALNQSLNKPLATSYDFSTSIHFTDINDILREQIELMQSQFEELKKKTELQQMQIEELSATNEHLVSATWREREIKKQLEQTLSDLSKEQEIKKQLELSLQELENSKQLLYKKNKAIKESINYSKKIQDSINPSNEELKAAFTDSFIWYQPKDVVSGDFPWVYQTKEHMYVAAVDCTGHGVPGAMLAIIGSLLMKKVVENNQANTPAAILDQLNDEVYHTLKQDTDEKAHDGMDIALLKIHKETRQVEFAGAHRPLYLIQENELTKVKGDRRGIGGEKQAKHKDFTNHSFALNEGDVLYVFSDGLTDQFGGEKDKKIGSKPIEEIITYYPKAKMNVIEDDLVEHFETWQGENEQTDDVLMIGLKL